MGEQQKIEEQGIEQKRLEQQRRQQQRMEQQRMEQQMREQQRIEQQMIEQQRIEQQREVSLRMEQQRNKEQQIMEEQRAEQQKLEHQRMEKNTMLNQGQEQQQMNYQRMEQEESMEEPSQLRSKIRAKDLPGAIKVMPLGLDAAIKKRVSGEFMSEETSNGMTFSRVSNKPEIINQKMSVQQQQKTLMQQCYSTEKISNTSSISSYKNTMTAAQMDLESEKKRKEYEAWLKNQEKVALEYSASINYQEKGSKSPETTSTVTSTEQISNQMKSDFES